MKAARKFGILLLVLLAFGGARLGFEKRMLDEHRELGLAPKVTDIETRDKIDQTSSAVALGGLRTLVATFLNIRAHGYFQEQRWNDLERTYHTIVDLAPHTRYYWEFGAWHLSYNASAYYIHDSELPSLRRRELWRSFIHRGRAFLERGIRNNPQDWKLHMSLAQLLRDPNKLPAFRDRDSALLTAAQSYQRSIDLGGNQPMQSARFKLYCLSRVKGQEENALQMARELHADPSHRTPTLLMLLYVLECHADPDRDVEPLALEVFGSAEKAYKALKLHWLRTREGYPMDGVALGLARMEDLLGIPSPESILAQPPPPPASLDDWFQKD